MADEVRASHILLMHTGSERSTATRTKEEAAEEIAGLQSQLSDGTDFAELASAHSDCPSGSKGGDLGSFGRGMMAAEFETAAFGLEIGDTSGIVETAFGYHLIMRTG